MPMKWIRMTILKKKNCFFLISQGSLNLKIRVLGQEVCFVARAHTQTDTKVNTGDTLSDFHEFFLKHIIKDRSGSNNKTINNNKK